MSALIRQERGRLEAANISTAALDARLLFQYVSGFSHNEIITASECKLERDIIARYERAIDRRLRHEPVSRIIGRRSFYDGEYLIDRSTLDPRPDSEILVDHALSIMPPKPARLLDLGTGSGCLLISLLRQVPAWAGVGVDLQPAAVRMARINAARLGVDARAIFRQGRWFDPVRRSTENRFDMIVSNPPYIREDDRAKLAPEVSRYDPSLALYGGASGLRDYRHIVSHAPQFLKPDGWLVCEIGADQSDAVAALYAKAGFGAVRVISDLAGRPRVVSGQKQK